MNIYTAIACLLVALTLILTPMAPGGQVDTRNFDALPRWQYNTFNVFLISLGICSLVTAGLALAHHPATFIIALVLGALFAAVFTFDLARIFPVVSDPMPSQLLVLEVLNLALGGVLVVLAIQGLLA